MNLVVERGNRHRRLCIYGETLGDVNLVKDLDVEDDTQRFRIVTKRTRSIKHKMDVYEVLLYSVIFTINYSHRIDVGYFAHAEV